MNTETLRRAKALILDNNLVEAGYVLTELMEGKDFTNKSDLYATVADWCIKQNRYVDAIEYLKQPKTA